MVRSIPLPSIAKNLSYTVINLIMLHYLVGCPGKMERNIKLGDTIFYHVLLHTTGTRSALLPHQTPPDQECL